MVSGVVVYGGEPVWEGRLSLLGEHDRIATTLLDADGHFQIVNPPLGIVKVSVTNHPVGRTSPSAEVNGDWLGVAKCNAPKRAAVELPGRYAALESSSLTIEIEPGNSHVQVVVPHVDGDPLPVVRPVRPVGSEVGNEAPEIEGIDFAGNSLRLSEHRGQVVALVFWAHWCNLCRAEFPHYRNLVSRYQDEPFVLLGVNCDPDRPFLERENARIDIPWRSWWDGASIGGPVTTAYQFQGFPAVVLIDRAGTIRYRNLRGTDLDEAIHELLKSST